MLSRRSARMNHRKRGCRVTISRLVRLEVFERLVEVVGHLDQAASAAVGVLTYESQAAVRGASRRPPDLPGLVHSRRGFLLYSACRNPHPGFGPSPKRRSSPLGRPKMACFHSTPHRAARTRWAVAGNNPLNASIVPLGPRFRPTGCIRSGTFRREPLGETTMKEP